jgi:hypothetical protein
MFWVWLWMVLTGCIMFTRHITMARGDKRLPRALWDAIVANLIFGALLVWRSCVNRQPALRAKFLAQGLFQPINRGLSPKRKFVMMIT